MAGRGSHHAAQINADQARRWRVIPAVAIGAILAIEIGILLATYSFGFDCIDFLPFGLCYYAVSLAEIRAVSFISALLLLMLAHPSLRQLLLASGSNEGWWARHWLTVQLVGFAILMLPWGLAVGGFISATLSLLLWSIGGALASASSAFAVASPASWRKALSEAGPAALIVLTIGALTPEIARLAQEGWLFQPLTRATFEAVVTCLAALGVQATADSASYILSAGDFEISVAPVCSGVEGFGLTLAFLGCYFYAFKDDLRFPNVLLLLPIALALSWLLNVVRIATLFSLGANGHEELAVKGFHSHAGWLAFSLLAFSVIGVSRAVPSFRKRATSRTEALPLLADWTAARVVPFAVFMGAALLLSTFTVVPDLWYGVKVLAISVALLLFLPQYRLRFAWRLDALSVAGGVVIAVLWLAFGRTGAPDGAPLGVELAALPATVLGLWIALRLAGTIVLVPLVEELFFRGYVLDRFSNDGLPSKMFGLLLSTALFAVMHERWLLASIAGVVYGLLFLRSGRLTDAIVAHATSNALIGFYALANWQWSLI